MQMMFVFVPSRHERNPITDQAVGNGNPIWEMRSIPGNLIGVGRTPQEATLSVMSLIEWTCEGESSFEDWYRESWRYSDYGDDELFGKVVTKQQRALKSPEPIGSLDACGMVASPA